MDAKHIKGIKIERCNHAPLDCWTVTFQISDAFRQAINDHFRALTAHGTLNGVNVAPGHYYAHPIEELEFTNFQMDGAFWFISEDNDLVASYMFEFADLPDEEVFVSHCEPMAPVQPVTPEIPADAWIRPLRSIKALLSLVNAPAIETKTLLEA